MLINLTQNLELSQLDFRQQLQCSGKTAGHSRPVQHRNPRARGPYLRCSGAGREQQQQQPAGRGKLQAPAAAPGCQDRLRPQRRCRHLFLNSPSRRLRALNKILPTPPGVSITGTSRSLCSCSTECFPGGLRTRWHHCPMAQELSLLVPDAASGCFGGQFLHPSTCDR